MADLHKVGSRTPQAVIYKSESHKLHQAFPVKKGDTIATTGSTGMSTGVHCHYEIQLNGVYQNPRDYLGEE